MSSSMGTQSSTGSSAAQGGTGMSNQVYDLVSVLYHSLESSSTNQRYIQDAQQSGDQNLVQFFQQIQQQDRDRAQQAQQLLQQTLGGSGTTH